MTKLTKKEENISALVGFLIIFIIFAIGINTGMIISNILREPTWHSPKGCPLNVKEKPIQLDLLNVGIGSNLPNDSL